MLELEPAHRPDELGEPVGRRPVGQRRVGRSQHPVEDLVDHRVDEQLLGREPPVQGPHTDPGPLGDHLHADIDARLVEDGAGRSQDLGPVLCGRHGGVPAPAGVIPR